MPTEEEEEKYYDGIKIEWEGNKKKKKERDHKKNKKNVKTLFSVFSITITILKYKN